MDLSLLSPKAATKRPYPVEDDTESVNVTSVEGASTSSTTSVAAQDTDLHAGTDASGSAPNLKEKLTVDVSATPSTSAGPLSDTSISPSSEKRARTSSGGSPEKKVSSAGEERKKEEEDAANHAKSRREKQEADRQKMQ